MARTRLIHPGAPADEDVATMSIAARYLWAYLPCHADRAGRLRDSAFTLKAAVFPGDAIDVETLLTELAAREHIIRYAVGGRRFIQIRTFMRHQNPHTRETPTEIPDPPTKAMPRHDLGDAQANDELHRVASSPCDPVIDPVISLGSSLPVVLASPPDQTRAESKPEANEWSVWDWRRKYGIRWCAKYGGTAIGGDGDGDANLREYLDALTPMDRLAAQARAEDMFAEFLAEGGEPAKARHRWSWFVGRWNALRVPMQALPRAGPPRDVRVGHAMAEVKPRAAGVQKL